jgi:hypothetical protein
LLHARHETNLGQNTAILFIFTVWTPFSLVGSQLSQGKQLAPTEQPIFTETHTNPT